MEGGRIGSIFMRTMVLTNLRSSWTHDFVKYLQETFMEEPGTVR